MATEAVLVWTPVNDANSTGQTVQQKLSTEPTTWTTVANVAKTVTTYTITPLSPNLIYDFRILNVCTTGGPTPGAQAQGANLTCPTPVTYTDNSDSIGYSFAHLGGNITRYVVELLSGATVVQTRTHNTPNGTIFDTFTGLTASTLYGVRITVYAGATQSYAKTCPVINRTTTAPQACNAPTGLTVTMQDPAP